MTDPLVDALVALCRQFGIYERDAICCGDVTVSQCVALQQLLLAPSDVSGLAAHLGVTVSASTRLLDGMKSRGWIERQRDPEDGRRVQIVLTEGGDAEARRLRDLTGLRIGAVLARIPPQEHAVVLHALRVLGEAIAGCDGDEVAAEGGCTPSSCC